MMPNGLLSFSTVPLVPLDILVFLGRMLSKRLPAPKSGGRSFKVKIALQISLVLPERFLTKVARDGDTFQMAVLNVVLQVSVDVFFPANLAPINQLAPGIFNRGFLH